MLNAAHYHATETLPNGLRLLIRATEPHDDLAGAIQRKVSPTSFFYRFLRPKRYLTDKDVASFVNCDFVSQVGLIGLVRQNLRMAIVAGARYWITRPDEAEIDIRRDPAKRMMHITVHLTETAPTEGLRTAKEKDMAGKR